MGDNLKNDKVSIQYFETPCKIGGIFSLDIVSSTLATKNFTWFFNTFEEAT